MDEEVKRVCSLDFMKDRLKQLEECHEEFKEIQNIENQEEARARFNDLQEKVKKIIDELKETCGFKGEVVFK